MQCNFRNLNGAEAIRTSENPYIFLRYRLLSGIGRQWRKNKNNTAQNLFDLVGLDQAVTAHPGVVAGDALGAPAGGAGGDQILQ